MAIITLHDVHVAFGSEVVFDKLALQLFDKEKLGMVGANGTGKSTILKLILGDVRADMGDVVISKGLRIGYLAQEASFSGERSVLQEMHAGVDHIFKMQARIEQISHELEALSGSALSAKMKEYDRLTHEFELAGGYEYETRINITLKGLGFDEALFHAPTSALSGGQLSRLGLARVLMLETDLLLLDEPTNHLDLQATEWLERFLVSYQGALVVISHDRYLLDRIATKIVEVGNRSARVWKGNYSNYTKTKETLRLQEEREHERRVEMVERTRDFIARNKDQEGMRKTARGRKTRLERLLKENPDYLEKSADQSTIHFSFARTERKGDLVLRLENLSKAFDDLVLFQGLTLDILAGERLGITGPNGTGKSTFVKLALGQLEPSGGTVRRMESLTVGYLDQHGDILDPDKTVLDEARSANPGLSPEKVRNRLGAFLFTGDDVFKETSDLSGGQRNRLMLCRLVLAQPDVLVMDEPTNHLDIASREMLEQAMDAYTGTILVVSHDRYFLDKTVDKLMVVGTDEQGRRCLGQTEFISGKPTYSYYASLIRQRQEEAQTQKLKSRSVKKQRADAAPSRSKTPEELKRFNKYSVEQIEAMIMEIEDELVDLKERFGEEAVYKNPGLLAELQKDYDMKTSELDLLYRVYERREA